MPWENLQGEIIFHSEEKVQEVPFRGVWARVWGGEPVSSRKAGVSHSSVP